MTIKDARLTGTNVNHNYPMGPHLQRDPEGSAFEDIMSAYSPFAQLQTLTTMFRVAWGTKGYMGSGESYSLDHLLSRTFELSGFSARLDRQMYGGGKGITPTNMLLSTAGEAVERMLGSLAFLETKSVVETRMATANELAAEGVNHLTPADYKMFSEEQYEDPGFLFDKWLDSTRCRWAKGTDLINGTPYWVPSQLVYLFHVNTPGEARIGSSSSGGLTTHVDATQARLHGILENIERDAINLRWYCGIPPEHIVIDRPFRNKRINEWFESARRSNVNVRMYYHSLDISDVAVVTIVAFDPELEELRYFAGGGVGLDIEDAIASAIGEFIQSERMNRLPLVVPDWGIAKGVRRGFGAEPDEPPERLDNFIQIVAYYGYRKHEDKLHWYFNPPVPKTVKLSTLPAFQGTHDEKLTSLLDSMKARDFRVIEFDFTPSMFKSIKLKKILCPDLVPAFPPNIKMLGHPRYFNIQRAFGMSGNGEQALTLDPLPYP